MATRISTGIPDLDSILGGGLPLGNTVLLAGGSGMGKTTLASQFLCHGAAKGERGLLFSVTEPVSMLQRNLASYSFFDPSYLNETLQLIDFRIISRELGIQPLRFTAASQDGLLELLQQYVKEKNIKRFVIDSITAICQWIGEPAAIRHFIFRLGLLLSESDVTSLLISETPPRALRFSTFGVEEFITDGILFLSEFERQNELLRTAQVIKMRGTNHSRAKYLLDLSHRGVELSPLLASRGP